MLGWIILAFIVVCILLVIASVIITYHTIPQQEKVLKKMSSTVGADEYNKKKAEVESLGNISFYIFLAGLVGTFFFIGVGGFYLNRTSS